MNSTDEFLYGKEVADRIQAFGVAAKVIEDEYKSVFTERPSRLTIGDEEKPSTIEEFYMLNYHVHGATLSIHPEVPLDIEKELKEAFKRIFS